MNRLTSECVEVKGSAAGQARWSPAQDAMLRQLWGVEICARIGRRISRTEQAVRRRASLLKLPRLKHPAPPRSAKSGRFVPLSLMQGGRLDSPHRKPSLPKLKFMGEL